MPEDVLYTTVAFGDRAALVRLLRRIGGGGGWLM